MTPAEGLRAHLDLQGGTPHGVIMPIHWGTFNLAPHAWAEPGEWTKGAAEEAEQSAAFPRPGEPFEPAGRPPVTPWWQPLSAPLAHPWRTAESPAVAPVSVGELDLAESDEVRAGSRPSGL